MLFSPKEGSKCPRSANPPRHRPSNDGLTPSARPMNDHAEKLLLLRCIPQKVLTRCRDPAHDWLEKRERPVAVVFVDIEGCTRLCEDIVPRAMNQIIEERFSRFFVAVERADGTVNEIMGDGFMAIFDEHEIRNNARAAISVALAIQRQNDELNAQERRSLIRFGLTSAFTPGSAS